MTYKKRVSEIKLNLWSGGQESPRRRDPPSYFELAELEAYSSSPATLRFLFAWQAERRALMGGVYSISISLPLQADSEALPS